MAGGTRKASRTKQPITRHPLFPAILGLWFCALFGLGSLAIRATVLENAVVASGIDLIVPAAAPPLGMTARILLALLLGLVGALIGFALGSRIGRARPEAPQRRRTQLSVGEPPLPRRADRFIPADAPPPRPLSAFDELDDPAAQIAASESDGFGQRRRALAMAEPTGPDYALSSAPLPGLEATPLADCFDPDTADVLELAEALPEETFVPDDQPFAAVPPASTPPVFAQQPAHEPAEPSSAEAAPAPRPFDQDGATRRFAQPAAAPSPVAADLSAPASVMPRLMASDPLAAPDDRDDDDRGLPPRNLGLRFGAAPVSQPDPPQVAAAPEPEPEPAAVTTRLATGSAAEHLLATPLEKLSQLELIERLALSMQQRRDAAEAAAATPEPAEPLAAPADSLPRFGFEPRSPLPLDVPPATFGFEPRTPLALDEPPAAFAAPSATPEAPVPAALRPIGFDADPAEDDVADDVIPRFARPANAVAAAPEPVAAPTAYLAAGEDEPDEIDEPEGATENFSSLLELGRAPLRQPLIRIEEPVDADAPIEPVVVFPGQGSRPFASPAAQPATAEPLPEPTPGVRRFDAPTSQPAPPTAASRQDPEETERALRAALATLQRMSGAA